jgi:hypothetical protein
MSADYLPAITAFAVAWKAALALESAKLSAAPMPAYQPGPA